MGIEDEQVVDVASIMNTMVTSPIFSSHQKF
jgi:hypothetical protein